MGPKKDMGGKTKKTRGKRKKDPNEPRRPCTPFIIYSNQQRPVLLKENPDARGIGMIAKIAGDQWRAMSEEDKAPYLEKAELDKKRYEKEMAAYHKKAQC